MASRSRDRENRDSAEVSPTRNGDDLNQSRSKSPLNNANSSGNNASSGIDREKICPFLLRVFVSTSRHNPIHEYSRGN